MRIPGAALNVVHRAPQDHGRDERDEDRHAQRRQRLDHGVADELDPRNVARYLEDARHAHQPENAQHGRGARVSSQYPLEVERKDGDEVDPVEHPAREGDEVGGRQQAYEELNREHHDAKRLDVIEGARRAAQLRHAVQDVRYDRHEDEEHDEERDDAREGREGRVVHRRPHQQSLARPWPATLHAEEERRLGADAVLLAVQAMHDLRELLERDWRARVEVHLGGHRLELLSCREEPEIAKHAVQLLHADRAPLVAELEEQSAVLLELIARRRVARRRAQRAERLGRRRRRHGGRPLPAPPPPPR
mmetsp:Transcript_24368/g.84688  ORF Transcript_24368/g.84688 Transcript_24368/m.84688 type:complete len:305 (-) Transcript_24368:329-1243(-)